MLFPGNCKYAGRFLIFCENLLGMAYFKSRSRLDWRKGFRKAYLFNIIIYLFPQLRTLIKEAMTNRWMIRELILNWIFMATKVSHSHCWCAKVHPSSRGQDNLNNIVALFYLTSSFAMQEGSYFYRAGSGEMIACNINIYCTQFLFSQIQLSVTKKSMDDRSAACKNHTSVYNLSSLFPTPPSHFSPTPHSEDSYLNCVLSYQGEDLDPIYWLVLIFLHLKKRYGIKWIPK